MANNLVTLNRSSYMLLGDSPLQNSLDYLTAKYQNIRFLLPAKSTFVITSGFLANGPGIAFELYGATEYWPFLLFYNGIVDYMNELVLGLVLQVPSKNDIDSLLNTQDSSEFLSVVI
jgi:hypothetical protein